MTIKKFLKLLSKVNYQWKLQGGDNIRSGCHCPITAVCAVHFNQSYSCSDVDLAAKVLGLKSIDTDDIVDAADYSGEGNKKLRQQLLTACNLT